MELQCLLLTASSHASTRESRTNGSSKSSHLGKRRWGDGKHVVVLESRWWPHWIGVYGDQWMRNENMMSSDFGQCERGVLVNIWAANIQNGENAWPGDSTSKYRVSVLYEHQQTRWGIQSREYDENGHEFLCPQWQTKKCGDREWSAFLQIEMLWMIWSPQQLWRWM